MKVAVSNLAWEAAADDAVASVLVDAGVGGVELAPTKVWEDPLAVGAAEAEACRRQWADRGLPIVAFQSLLFGHPELLLFGDADARSGFVGHLTGMIHLAGMVGASRLVLGSPANRRRGPLDEEEAFSIAVDAFARLAHEAQAGGVCLCIEPNPTDYGADFITDAASGRALARAVDHPGFGLHLDTGSMHLAGDDPVAEVAASIDVLRHVHCSEPGLVPPGPTSPIDHAGVAAALRDAGYAGAVSVEMLLPDADAETAQRTIRDVAAFAVRTYG